VDDVDEQRLSAELDQATLTFSFWDKSSMDFCHTHASPPHQPVHHGYEGKRMRVQLFEARAPDDARPFGPALATLDIDKADLPQTDYAWLDFEDMEVEYPPDSSQGNPYGPPICGMLNHNHPSEQPCQHPGNEKHTNSEDVPGGVA